ncbi:SIR2 family protein [Sphingobium sp. LMA1-1-1.1]|uniref:SIR2 family protein n=1 Tax=Sphingobium sp. LMA1-1-1.1 TaxID=3135238 RepID=UPI00341B2AA4
MRFVENGPSLPSHLLQEQSQGNVIFFCGAGVSVPAGLDSFARLTNRIITTLDAAKARQALAEGQSFDRVFNVLVREFGREEIDRQIYSALGVGKPRTLKHHRDILTLSRGASGNPQVVTTNFDQLFEQAGRGIRPIVPPGLPDIELNQPIRGVVYLHGRLADPKQAEEIPSYVIGSSDFGRAYLAEGWATRFVKALREKYTIVLLGYSADDPPMRYLLEGLNVRDGVVYHSPIYVFTDRSSDEAEEIWQDRGVTPICYTPDKTHSGLWRTIAAWAQAAKSQDRWTDQVLSLARQSPAELKPFERGQVVQLVSTKKGAKAFADAHPAPGAEWLSVFDPQVRYLKPAPASHDPEAEEIDPQDLYGLDDDPLRPSPNERRLVPDNAHNPLAWQKGDGFQPERVTLQGGSSLWQFPLPDRLHHLARWFGTQSHEPAALWWAAGSHRLNSHLLWFVSNRVRNRHGKDMPTIAQLIWSLHLEALDLTSEEERSDRWFEFEALLKKSGWTPAVARFFERCVTPYVQVARPFMSPPRPPLEDWDKLRIREVVDLKVASLDRHNHDVKCPPEALAQVARIVRMSLERISDLLEEIGDLFWHPPTLLPDAADENFGGKKAHNFLWFKQIFLALVAHDPNQGRREFLAWSSTETRIFPKFRLWAAADSHIATASEALLVIVSLPRDTLWNTYNQRELLHLLRARWSEWSFRQRRTVERLLEAGPPKWRDEKRGQYRERRAAYAANNLRWLEMQHCQLTAAGQRSLAKLKLVHPKWSDAWAEEADDSHEGRGGYVLEVDDPGDLAVLPLDQVFDTALARTKSPFRELKSYHPFRGLVQEHPYKALAALRAAYRKGKFSAALWGDLLSKWPDTTSPKLQNLLAHSVIRLSPAEAIAVRFEAPRWLEKHLPALYARSRANALDIFDGFLRPFLSSPPDAADSGIGATTIDGVEQKQSEVSINKAINSPIGTLTEALWKLTPKKAKRYNSLNRNLARRFEVLASAPGHGAGHAVVVLTQRLGWIDYCFHDWMQAFLLPMFRLDHPLAEAAWHGLAYNRNAMPGPFWHELKAPMLKILMGEASWSLDEHEREYFGSSVVWLSRPMPDFTPLFSFTEIREALSAFDDDLRGRILWALANSLQKHGQWTEFIKPFIENGWPRALRYRSDETTRGFVQIAERAGDHFPDAVKTVLPLIRPVPNADMLTYRISRDRKDKENIARNHPRAALQLLNAITPDDRARMPYELESALDALAELDPTIKDMPEYRRLRDLLE